MSHELDPGTLDFAHKVFELARVGETEQLTAYLDAGLPVNRACPQPTAGDVVHGRASGAVSS